MATETTNNQLTLYRFVSLRSPELTKKENQEKRFVLHPDNATGVFFDAVKNKPATQTNWEAMQNIASTFSVFENEDKILEFLKTQYPNIFKEFYQTADWIALNKSNFDPKELFEKIKKLEVLDLKVELKLWDNLFYQVLTQKSFYVKEALMQLLVLQNVLKQTKNLKTEDILNVLPTLANAKVILPEILFKIENENNTNANVSRIIEDDTLNNKIEEAQAIQFSKNSIENLNTLHDDIIVLEQKHLKEYQQKYNAEYALHQTKIAPIIADYQKKYESELRKQCGKPRPENYDPNDICNIPNIAEPIFPEFIFNFPQEVNLKTFQKQLSLESYELLVEILSRKEVETFAEIQQIITQKIQNESNTIAQKTIVSQKVISIGDTVFTDTTNNANNPELPFQVCSARKSNGKINVYLSVQLPNTSLIMQSFNCKLKLTDNSEIVSNFSDISITTNGSILTINNIFGDNVNFNMLISKFTGKITFTNGHYYTFDIGVYKLISCQQGKFIPIDIYDSGNTTTTNSFIPKGFGYKQIGIADYKKVVTEVCCYHAGEVAHIENVMASELRSKTTTKTFSSETTDFESTETEKETMSDLVSTERFEMQTEITKLLAEQRQTTAYADVHTSWPSTTLDAGGTFASNTNKEESNRQAVNQAKELTQRAMERITSRVKKEKTVKIKNEFTEQNTHVFDNTGNEKHISGVFRFINAEYKNQIYNYGKRVMYEFMVPQPSKLHELAMMVANNNENAVVLDKPIDPTTIGITDFTKITQDNYQNLASKYNAIGISLKPDEFIYIGKTFDKAETQRNFPSVLNGTIEIPENYKSIEAKTYVTGSAQGPAWPSWGSLVNVNVGVNPTVRNNKYFFAIDNYTTEVPINVGFFGYHLLNVTVTIKCQLSQNGLLNWQKDTFEKIMDGYREQLRLFNEKLSEAKTAGVQILGSNPLFYRQIEQLVLRKNCISYLLDNSTTSKRRFGRKMYTGDSITTHQIPATQEMDNYGSFAKFMEQAFEWNVMSYNFYPFYWGNDTDWSSLYQYETNDPIFRSFMQAGMARVIVTVKPGFEEAVMHYMATGQIWNGGQTPIIGDPLYLSIIDELKEQEYVVEETWKTIVPTHLIALQRSGVSVDEEGLPCNCPAIDELNKQFIINDKTLLAKTK